MEEEKYNKIITNEEKKALLDYCSKLETSVSLFLEDDISCELEASKKGRSVIYDNDNIDYLCDIILKVSSVILKYSVDKEKFETLYKITTLGRYTSKDNMEINKILPVIKSLAKKETFQDGNTGDILYIKSPVMIPYVKVSDVLDKTARYDKKIEYLLIPFTYIDKKDYICDWWDYKNYNILIKRQFANSFATQEAQEEMYNKMIENLKEIPEIIGEYKITLESLSKSKQNYDYIKKDNYYSGKKDDEEKAKNLISEINERLNEIVERYVFIKSLLFEYLKTKISVMEKDIIIKYSDNSEIMTKEQMQDDILKIKEMVSKVKKGYTDNIDEVSNILSSIKKCNEIAVALKVDFKVSADFVTIAVDYKNIIENLMTIDEKISNIKILDDEKLTIKNDNVEYVIKSYEIVKYIFDNIDRTYNFIFSLKGYFESLLYQKIDEKVNILVKDIEKNIILKRRQKTEEEKIGFLASIFTKKNKIKQGKLDLYDINKEMIELGIDGITTPTIEIEKSYVKMEQTLKYVDTSLNLDVNPMLFFMDRIRKNIDLDKEKIQRYGGIYKNNILNPLPIAKYSTSELFTYLKEQIKLLKEDVDKTKKSKLGKINNGITDKVKIEKMAMKINDTKSALYDMKKRSIIVLN